MAARPFRPVDTMWIKKHDPVRYLPADSGVTLPSRKPTPREVYMDRRKFVAAATIGVAGASPLARAVPPPPAGAGAAARAA